jgi:uncharacterized RDD family membrane protein YckC
MTTQQQPPAWNAAPAPPPGPSAGVRYGGFWVRVVAYILDGIITFVIAAALTPLFGGTMFPTRPEEMDFTGSGISLLVGLVYFVAFWSWRGQTPGMMPFNMTVVRADDGGKIDWVRALLRYVGLIISFLVIFIGVIWVAFDSRKQGWHDKIAGTVVVRPA